MNAICMAKVNREEEYKNWAEADEKASTLPVYSSLRTGKKNYSTRTNEGTKKETNNEKTNRIGET